MRQGASDGDARDLLQPAVMTATVATVMIPK